MPGVRLVLILIGLLSGACGPSEPAPPPAPPMAPQPATAGSRPNVLLVVLDTTRRDRLSTYGYERDTSPALDRIAAEGTVFENAITSAPWTLPSHASMFTGLYPRDHGATVESYRLADEHETLAEVLQAEGYQTLGISCNPWIDKSNGFTQGFELYYDVWRELDRDSRDMHGAALATDRALDWTKSAEGQTPWFLFVNYLEPHNPYSPPPPHRYRYVPKSLDLATVQRVADWDTPREFGYMLGQPGYEISEAEFVAMNALYDGEISYMDTRLGELLEGLRMRGVLDHTLVVIVADHGEQLGEHGMLEHKMTLYEDNIRVPLVLRYPPAVPAGQRIDAPVQAHDLYPTILQLVGIEHPLPRGAALLPLDANAPRRTHTFVQFGRPTTVLKEVQLAFPGVDVSHWDRRIQAVRGTRFKAIAYSDGKRQLFDLQEDPGENQDLSARQPDTLRELETLIEHFSANPVPAAAPTQMDPEQIEALRALGYVP